VWPARSLNLAKGKNLAEAALAAARERLPGGPAARAAFDAAVALAKGQRLQDAAFAAAGRVLPPSPYAADALAFAKRVANGQNIQHAALSIAGQRAMRQVRNAAGLVSREMELLEKAKAPTVNEFPPSRMDSLEGPLFTDVLNEVPDFSAELHAANIEPPSVEDEFRLGKLPPRVKAQFPKGGGAWQDAVAEAIKAGIRNPSKLASLIFFMQHAERMKADEGQAIRKDEDDFVRLRAEWNLYRTIATGKLSRDGRPQCSLFLPANVSSSYTDFRTGPTTGRITLFVHGRSGKDQNFAKDQLETFSSMQQAVESTLSGDLIYLAAWRFNPAQINLTAGTSGKTWADLLFSKAAAGVKIRIIMSDFDPLAIDLKSDLTTLNALITKLDQKRRDNFKYIVSMHPAKGTIVDPRTHRLRLANVATHHQKILIIRRGGFGTAFCGGLDIADERTPNSSHKWVRAVWHDTHAKLEGRIVRDLEREFVERWNREKGLSTASKLPDWQPYETLRLSEHSDADRSGARNPHKLQMLRTVSTGQSPQLIKRDDIWQAYFGLIGCATNFLYFENQYFTEVRMADAIVKQTEAQKGLIVIFVIPLRTDDPENALTDHIRALQHDFFTQIFDTTSGIPRARLRVFGMVGRWVHSKFILADDRALSLGSANANQRGFYLDSELNVVLDDADAARTFRHRLWAHDLGVPESLVAGWKVSEFLSQWDAVAKRNAGLATTPEKMSGEAVFPFDPLTVKGKKTFGIPDVWGEI
jgi:phosphatidylserine/phosphatidylglycerophosphate/cardiolipin synthase-like enzyme